MSETKVMICDVCGAESKRDGFKFPAGWMHVTAYYRPSVDTNGYAGYCDVDMCPACVQKDVGVTGKLREGSLQEWNMSVVNRREARRPFLRFLPSSAAYAGAGRRCPSAPIPGAIGCWPSCATTDGIYGCSVMGATRACARIAMT